MTTNYTTAAYELLVAGVSVDTVLDGVRQVMQRRGHIAHYPAVLRALLDRWEAFEQKQQPVVAIARADDESRCAAIIREQLAVVAAPGTYRTRIAPELIGGSRVEYDHRVVDGSYKASLLRLYKQAVQAEITT